MNRVFRGPPRLVEVFSGVVLAAVAATGAVGIRGVMLETRRPAGAAALVRDLADLVQARASETKALAVVIRVSQPVWVEAAGLVLQLRKRGVPATVDGDVGFVFGLPPDGSEGAVFELTRASAESLTNMVKLSASATSWSECGSSRNDGASVARPCHAPSRRRG